MLEAVLRLPVTDSASRKAAVAALGPEADDGPAGSTLQLTSDGAAIVVTARAPDLATLRATVNGAIRLLDTALRVAGGPGGPDIVQ